MSTKIRDQIIVYLALFGIVACWAILWKIYSLFTYNNYIYFALDKISGHFFSPTMLFTTSIFVLLLLLYGIIISKKYNSHISINELFLFIFLISIFAVSTYPVGALDVFNYVLIGKLVLFYQQNPFTIPFDAVGYTDQLHKYAIFLNVTTGYGPWWVVITSIVLLFTGVSTIVSMVLGYKIITFIFYLLTGGLLYLLQENKEYKTLSAAVYLLNPFIIFEGLVNAHNDIIVAFFLLFALWAFKKKNIAVILLVILAGLIKLYVLSVLPIFLLMMIKEKWSKRDIIISFLLASVCFILLYLPFWDEGRLLAGTMKGLYNAQTINGFSPYSLVREYLVNIKSVHTFLVQYVFLGIFFLLFITTLFYTLKTKEYINSSIFILLLFLLLVTILQPWYLIPVLGLLALSVRKNDLIFSFIISSGALLSYSASIWGWFHSGWSAMQIHIFLACFISIPSIIYTGFLLKTAIFTRNKVLD